MTSVRRLTASCLMAIAEVISRLGRRAEIQFRAGYRSPATDGKPSLRWRVGYKLFLTANRLELIAGRLLNGARQ